MENREKTFTIDKKVYSDLNIKKCCKIFSENYDFTYNNSELTLKCWEDNDILFLEFMNYLLYLELNKNG